MSYLQSKPRYEILDGLRGVAAIMVVAFHLFESYAGGDHTNQILNHSYLAVDFFFMLSGFVIAYAYDDRWDKMSLTDFFKRRLVRLHPMIVVGSLIGGALFYLSGGEFFPLVFETPWWKMLLLTLLGCLMIPALPSWDIRGWKELNSLNGAGWSMMFEYITNIIYALVIRRFSNCALGALVALSSLLTLDVVLKIDTFNLLGNMPAYTVIGGFGLAPDQLYIGFARLLYPFFMGLLLSRLGKFITIKRAFEWSSFILIIVFAMPHIGGKTHMYLDGIYNALIILLIFPLVVLIGAGSRINGARSLKTCNFLGAISYPLYITHYPWIYFHINWVNEHKHLPLSVHICVSIGLFIVAFAIAYATMCLYDIPIREWLKRRFLMNTK